MFQKHRYLKKRQVMDELEIRNINVPEKIVVKALKVCIYGYYFIASPTPPCIANSMDVDYDGCHFFYYRSCVLAREDIGNY